MSKNEVNKFRRILEANVTELDRSARHRDAIAIERTADELDLVIRAAESELAVRTLEAGSVRLREVKAALRRIEEGSFGFCLECDEEISPRRLAALPWASLCIQCKEAVDGDCRPKVVRPALAMAA